MASERLAYGENEGVFDFANVDQHLFKITQRIDLSVLNLARLNWEISLLNLPDYGFFTSQFF